MANSSILGGTPVPAAVAGKDTDALGPSDNSDSGSDAQGAYGDGEMHSDSDSVGTGERATVGRGFEQVDADILPDHIEKDGEEVESQEIDELESDESDETGDDAESAEGNSTSQD